MGSSLAASCADGTVASEAAAAAVVVVLGWFAGVTGISGDRIAIIVDHVAQTMTKINIMALLVTNVAKKVRLHLSFFHCSRYTTLPRNRLKTEYDVN